MRRIMVVGLLVVLGLGLAVAGVVVVSAQQAQQAKCDRASRDYQAGMSMAGGQRDPTASRIMADRARSRYDGERLAYGC